MGFRVNSTLNSEEPDFSCRKPTIYNYLYTIEWLLNKPLEITSKGNRIDWNCNGIYDEKEVSTDINRSGEEKNSPAVFLPGTSVLKSVNDWEIIENSLTSQYTKSHKHNKHSMGVTREHLYMYDKSVGARVPEMNLHDTDFVIPIIFTNNYFDSAFKLEIVDENNIIANSTIPESIFLPKDHNAIFYVEVKRELIFNDPAMSKNDRPYISFQVVMRHKESGDIISTNYVSIYNDYHIYGGEYTKEGNDIEWDFLTHNEVVADTTDGTLFGLAKEPLPPPDKYIRQAEGGGCTIGNGTPDYLLLLVALVSMLYLAYGRYFRRRDAR